MDIGLTRLFVKVIQHGSFSRAADALRIPKSTVSKAVTRLENETGTKLLLRTTRSLTLTASGRTFYEACVAPIQILEDAQKSLYGQDNVLSGSVKITAPEDLGSQVIAPAIGELSKTYPKLNFELIYTDDVLDLVKEGFDLAVRLGKLKESNLRAKKIGEVILIPVASPAYLKTQDKIDEPQDFARMDCLTLADKSARVQWPVHTKKGIVRVDINPRIVCNQMSSLLKITLAGAGVSMLPRFLCQPYIASGQIVALGANWRGASFPVSIVSPLSSSHSARLKLVVEKLDGSLRKVLTK